MGLRRRKEMEEVEKEVDEVIEENQEVEPVEEDDDEEDKTYLLSVIGADYSQNVVIVAPTLLYAVMKFAHKYNEECKEWIGVTFSVEEVEVIN